MKRYILLIFFLLLPLNVAAKELNIKCDKYTFKEFEEFTCRTSINTSFEFNKLTFELDLSKGLSIDEVRTNYTGLWQLSIDNNKVTAETKNGVLVSGLQEFGILLFGTMEYGTQKINLKNITLINSSENKTLDIEETSKEIQILSSENKLKNIYIDDKKIERFNSNIYSYVINIDKSSKVNITADLIDDNSNISGIGEIEIESDNQITIVPIIVKSESGVNRVYYIYLVSKDILESDIVASLIELKDNKNNIIDFKFNPNIYEYNLEVDPKISSINLNIQLDDSNLSLVKNYGNRTITIEDGDNPVIIKIKNNNGEVKTYVINITKLLSNKSANCYLKSLSIDKYDLRFNKKVKIYNLQIKKSTKKLDITALTEDAKSTFNIIGNEELKNGSIVKIIVKAENGSSFTYQLQIAHKKSNLILNLACGTLIVVLFGIINELFKKYKNKSDTKKITDKNPKVKEHTVKKAEVKKEVVKKTKTTDKKAEIKKEITKKTETTKTKKAPVKTGARINQSKSNNKQANKKTNSKKKNTNKKKTNSNKSKTKK